MHDSLLTIGHSYVVGLNRAWPRALAAARPEARVTVAAPRSFRADFGPARLHSEPDDARAGGGLELVGVPAPLARSGHALLYSPRGLEDLLALRPWSAVLAWCEPYTFAGGQIARAARRRAAGSPLVFATFQNLDKRYPPPWSWIERSAMRQAAGWIAFGRLVHETLAARPGYRDTPAQVIPLGIDTERFRPRDRDLDESDRPLRIGYAGRFVREKGVLFALEVLERLAAVEGVRPWRAEFVGGGPLEGELRRLADRSVVEVRTAVPHDAMPEILRSWDVLLVPSRTTLAWKEQLGRIVLEGMASGLAVLGSDSGEIPLVIGDGGLVLPEQDPAAWVNALATLARSQPALARLGGQGRARALSAFSWDAVARSTWDFLDGLRAGRPASPCS